MWINKWEHGDSERQERSVDVVPNMVKPFMDKHRQLILTKGQFWTIFLCKRDSTSFQKSQYY